MNIFKNITVGGVPKEILIQRLIESGVQFNEYAKILFEHQDFSPESPCKNFTLIKMKPTDLGLNNPYSLEDAITLASSFGLLPCPLYLAAFLRLEYLDQAEGPYLTVVSHRPEYDENYPAGFYIRKLDNTLWLRGYGAFGKCDHPSNNELIFLK
ncbi:MAG: hypothetical protein WC635_12340 [Bacteriovorax sp.]|jgi:hypothetical protein